MPPSKYRERKPIKVRAPAHSYMDCRREANRRGLTLRGTQKIFDSSLASIGTLYAKQRSVFRSYHDRVFERFWKRELYIENPTVLAALLTECDADAAAFPAFLEGEGRRLLHQIQLDAEAAGVFRVPTFLLEDGDLYWGREHLPRIRELLRTMKG
jgi:2-hydroxychromene-2-carboxylate isomerase